MCDKENVLLDLFKKETETSRCLRAKIADLEHQNSHWLELRRTLYSRIKELEGDTKKLSSTINMYKRFISDHIENSKGE